MSHIVLAGGGSAGHVEPLLNTADALRRRDPGIGVSVLGTAEGLESRLVPARGYDLIVVPKVPLPRRPSADLFRIPGRLRAAVRIAQEHLLEVRASAVVGFGGYVSVPAYLAARRVGIPIVVHEANARPGLANRLGARFAAAVATTVPGTLRGEQVVGLPLRRSIAELDRPRARANARAAFGLPADGPVLLVTGGSQGARQINAAICASAVQLAEAGISVLHVTGPAQIDQVRDHLGAGAPSTHVVVDYVDGMDSAYAAADVAVCRSGAMTCGEVAAVGLPAVFIPLPIGNGEQALNAEPLVAAGAAMVVADARFDAAFVRDTVVPLMADRPRLEQMSHAASALGRRGADEALVDVVLDVLR